jgi:pseudouridine kinase
MRIACIGGAHLDRHAVLKAPFIPATSNPGNVTTSFGGVARNVAENLARLGREVAMVSLVGDDEAGRAVVAHLQALRIETSALAVAPARATASYTAILQPDGELVMGLADMDLYEVLTPALLESTWPILRDCDVWFVDANLPAVTIAWLAQQADTRMLAADAVSVPKSARLVDVLARIGPLFLNRAQRSALPDPLPARCGVVTAGPLGVAAWNWPERIDLRALPAHPRDVTGAGDALIAGTLFGLTGGLTLFDAVPLGLAAAAITVESPHTVAPELTAELMYARLAANRS